MKAGRPLRPAWAVLGLLDGWTLARHGVAALRHSRRYLGDWGSWPFPVRGLEVTRAVLFPSFLASALGLLGGYRWALLLSLVQAPARLVLMVFENDGAAATFGFLQDLGRAGSMGVVAQHVLFLAAVVLEIARAVFAALAWWRLRG